MRGAAFLLALAAGIAWAADAPPPKPVTFTADSIKRIAALGPWPPAPQRDPSNRVSGSPSAIALGARLFADTALSRDGAIACATCHQASRALTDGRARAQGLALADRNTPSLGNTGHQRWYGWDGAGDSLWAQSLRPLLDPREMGSDVARLARHVREDASLRTAYTEAFQAPPDRDDETVAVDAAKALAAFEETLVTGRTPFDDFRDALLRGDRAAMARYPVLAQRGLAIFVGSGNCIMCHGGPRFTNGEFHDTGIAFFVEPGRVDPGRYDGIRKLRASRFNLLGPYNDDAARATAVSTRYVALEHRNYGEFKVPSLRNVARTAPYMHNGSLGTLREVVRHYSSIDLDRLHADGEQILKPLDLDKYDVDALVAFLESLSD
jgi:cytochrome c peroxidase